MADGIMEAIATIKRMDLEYMFGLMVVLTLASGLMEFRIVKESTFSLMDKLKRASGKEKLEREIGRN